MNQLPIIVEADLFSYEPIVTFDYCPNMTGFGLTRSHM